MKILRNLTAVMLAMVYLPALAQEAVVVEAGSPMSYLANASDPGIGLAWTLPSFDDTTWTPATYGVGFELATGAEDLIQTSIPGGTFSLYTRTTFDVVDINEVLTLSVGADYDDGYTVWINGVEVFRSLEMPAGVPNWNTSPTSHESSNAQLPVYDQQDISLVGIPALQNGINELAIGVWNVSDASSDLLLVPRLIINAAFSLVRGPYLQLGTSDAITVRWRTIAPTDSRVVYGLSPGVLNFTAFDPAVTIDHEVKLINLTNNETFFYAVGDGASLLVGGDDRHFFVTAPMSGTSKQTRVWVLGDSGTADQNAKDVRDAYYEFTNNQHTDLWLMLGDNAYPSGTDPNYQLALFDIYPDLLRKSVLWPTLGNHDGVSADSPSQTGPYYDIFTLPAMGGAGGVSSGTEAYYSFDYGNIHFVVLDSFDTIRSPGGAMMTWLNNDLAANTQDWAIAFWHHPPYSKGSHDSDTEAGMIDMRQNALPILESQGVDLVLTGHSHSYERSFLIDGHYGDSSTFLPTMQIDAGDGRPGGNGAYMKSGPGPFAHEGAVYAVAGSSGRITGGTLNHSAMFISWNQLGSMVLDIDNDRLDAIFLDSTGATLDEFTIIKNVCSDLDADGVCGDVDNCPDIANPGQEDGDGDGVGDVCDECPIDPDNDVDNDNVCGDVDNCPIEPNSNQSDQDMDGAGDACDICPFDPLDDVDGDGVCGDDDNCPIIFNPDQIDNDGDGLGDACDPCPLDVGNTDGDGDGIPNACDCAPLSPAVAFSAGPLGPSMTIDKLAVQPGGGERPLRLQWRRGIQGHVSNVYRALSGNISLASCLAPETPALESVDTQSLPPGGLFIYLISAENVCGESTLGEMSDGQTRASPVSCPSVNGDIDIDGVPDAEDNCPLVHDPTLADFDLDFVGDLCDNCPVGANPNQQDGDSDKIGDICDNCPSATNTSQLDFDFDGFGDVCDNCPVDSNEDQDDRDGDGVGDACDNCQNTFNPDQADSNGNGKGDACE